MGEALLGNPNIGWSGGVFREHGHVRKVLLRERADAPAHWRASDDERAWNYWRREQLVYESGLPAQLGLDAPVLLGVDRRGEELHLLLEDVPGRTGAALDVGDLTAAARALGRAQGRRDLPRPRWLSRGFLRDYPATRPVERGHVDSEAPWAHPLAREYLPARVRPAAQRVRHELAGLQELAAGLPRTVCHLDVWPHNLVARPDGRSAFLDWSFCGDGALGEDVGNLVPDSVFDRLLPFERLAELDERATAAYLDGLREAGCAVDQRLVRLAICLCGVLKYEWLFAWTLRDIERGRFGDYGGAGDVDAHAFLLARGAGLDLLAGWLDEAERLAARR